MNGVLEGARGLMILSDHQVHMPSPDRSVISDTSPSDANDSFESMCNDDEMEELINKQNQERLVKATFFSKEKIKLISIMQKNK